LDAFENKRMQIALAIFSEDNSVEICNVFIQNEYWCEVVNFGSHENSVDFA
jgi:hypothetical protein